METQIQTYKCRRNDISMDFQNNTKKHQRGQSKSWQYLPQDILESILRRLCLRDFLNLGLVCSSWHSMLSGRSKQCHPIPQIPLLLLCPHNETSDKVPCFFELNKGKILHPKNRLYPRGQIVRGTIDGWLLMAETTNVTDSLFFFNPVTGAKVMLPLEIHGHDHFPKLNKMVASSAPRNNCHDDSIIVVGLAHCRIIFCKIIYKSWNLIGDGKVTEFSDIAIIGNLLYVVVNSTTTDAIEIYNLIELDKSSKNDVPKAEKLVVLDPKPKINMGWAVEVRNYRIHFDNSETIQLLHDVVSGDLMLIMMRFDFSGSMLNQSAIPIVSKIKGFKVFKLDRTTHNGIRWVEVEDLGDHLIFLNRRECKLISTVGFQESVRRNCIYFAINKYQGVGRPRKIYMGMFCLSNKSFHYFRVTNSVTRNWSKCYWFTPSL